MSSKFQPELTTAVTFVIPRHASLGMATTRDTAVYKKKTKKNSRALVWRNPRADAVHKKERKKAAQYRVLRLPNAHDETFRGIASPPP